jgi:hypothetical protein
VTVGSTTPAPAPLVTVRKKSLACASPPSRPLAKTIRPLTPPSTACAGTAIDHAEMQTTPTTTTRSIAADAT